MIILGTNSIKDTGFNVDNSVRLDNNAYFNRTFGSGGSVKKWTWSSWFKVSYIGGNEQVFFSHFDDSSNFSYIKINGNNKLEFRAKTSGSTILRYTLTRRFRDPSAFMHLVVALDTSLATSTDRIKIWINGIRETAFDTSTAPAQDAVTLINSAVAHEIGHAGDGSDYFQGYMSQVCFVDNVQYDADQFGEYNSDSPTIWQPKDVSGLSTGATSFFLDFADSGDLGDDESGNTNDFTENNLAATDQSTDTCTNNFATINPLDNYYAGNTFSEGNLKVVTNASVTSFSTSTFGVASGKWYFEHKIVTQVSDHVAGITSKTSTATDDWLGNTADTWSLITNGSNKCELSNNNNRTDVSSTLGYPTDGDIIGIYIDLDNYKLYFAKNGTLASSTGQSLTVSGSTTAGFYFAGAGDFGGSANTIEFNFGSPTFSISSSNSDPNGYGSFEHSTTITGDGSSKSFYAICTKNLAEFGG